MGFIDWSTLATYTGALAMVVIITQLTKGLKWISRIPTQIWSYIVAIAVLYSAFFFTDQLTASNAVLILFNGVIVALASNGGFDAVKHILPKLFSGDTSNENVKPD